MYVDAQLLFSDAQAVTADATSTNVVDLGAARKIFDGEPMAVVLTVDVAADGTTTDETYEFEIHTDDNAGMSSSTQLIAQAIGYAALTAGSTHVIPVPVGATLERYLAVKYDVGGTSPSITCTAFLQPLSMVQKYTNYADNITIS
jgi:hypothetical protein